MPIDPGRTDGGRRRIGERVEVRVPDATLERIDAVLHAARGRYVRVPRELRSRPALIRACVEAQLASVEARVSRRPAPD